jgi:hypothetical protein
MQVEKCSNCGAQLTPGPDGRISGCPYCSHGANVAVDPNALAATLGRDMNDVKKFLEHLANTLESAFPGSVVVEKSGLFSKHVSKLEVTAKNMIYRLELHGHHITAHKTRAVGGISLKNETVPVAQWLGELSTALAQIAQESADARNALARAIR